MSRLIALITAFASLASIGGCPFMDPLCELTVSVDGAGVTDPGGGVFVAGTVVTLTATPDEGWRFDHWEGDVWETDETVELTLDSDLTARAVFVQVHELSLSVEGSGSVDPSAGIFDDGSTVTLTATPDEGWRFDRWEGDVFGTDEAIEVTLDSDLTIRAVFVQTPAFTVDSTLRTMCPTLNDEQIELLIADLTGHFENGDSVAEALVGVGGRCIDQTPDEDDAVTCAMCQAAMIVRIWGDAASLEMMCPTLNDEQIDFLVADLVAHFENGDSLAEARRGVGGRCIMQTPDEDDAITCAMCEVAATLQVWE